MSPSLQVISGVARKYKGGFEIVRKILLINIHELHRLHVIV